MACERSATTDRDAGPAASAASSSTSTSTSTMGAGDAGKGDGSGDGSGRGRGEGRKREAFVYLDGKPLGVIRKSELPPSFAPTMVVRGTPFPIYPVARYLELLGADPKKLREVHLVGGNRVGVISGKELVRVRDKLHFAFQRATSGKPRMDWPDERIDISTKIDQIMAIYAFQEKEPPRYDRDARGYVDAKGKAIEGIPYAANGPPEGTRVYRDGVLVASIRRRDLDDAIVLDGEGAAPRYSLAGYLKDLGVAPAAIRGVDFVADERTVARLAAADWNKHSAALAFVVPDKSRGRVRIALPDASKPADVSAIAVYLRLAPPP